MAKYPALTIYELTLELEFRKRGEYLHVGDVPNEDCGFYPKPPTDFSAEWRNDRSDQDLGLGNEDPVRVRDGIVSGLQV